jgi:fucose 4-O-acetylase-like acetyltransferase
VGAQIDELVERTPATRDRYVDFLRAASILAVVFGHWFVAITIWEGGLIRYENAVGVTPGLWLGSWIFQVMPIFFFVGGFSNLVTLDSMRRRGMSTAQFVKSRVQRLLRPSIVFLGVWFAVQLFLHLADVGRAAGPGIWGDTRLLRGMLPPAATIPFGPLWFLAVYLVVVAVSPLTVALHRRFGWKVPVAMAVGTIVVDIIGFGVPIRAVRFLNVVFVLFFPHQLGHAYADGSLTVLPRRTFWAMVIGGLGALVLLTNPWFFRLAGEIRFEWFPGIGHYPKSLIGTDVEAVSNAYPPTVCYLAQSVWSIGAVMLIRPAASRWLQRTRPWKLTIGVNSVIMTLFLWHMTAFLLALLLMWPLGFGRERDSTLQWWLERVIWLAVPGTILAGLVAIFGRFERPRARAPG